MRLGLSSYACAWAIGVPGFPSPRQPLDAVGLIRRAAALNLHLVQIADNLPLEFFSSGQVKAIGEAASEHAVELELGTRGIAGEQLRVYIDLCRALQSRLLRVVVDSGEHQPSPAEIVGTLRAVVPLLRAANVTLAVENHDRLRVRELAEIVRQLDADCIGICLDTVNSFGALEGPEVVVRTLAPYVVNVHVKDFVVRRVSYNLGFEITGAPAGSGQLDFPWLLSELKAARCDPNLILELWPPAQLDVEQAAALEESWCEQSIRYLRAFCSASSQARRSHT